MAGWAAAMAVAGWAAVTVASAAAAPCHPAPARGRARATRRTGRGRPGGAARSFGRRGRALALELGRRVPAGGAACCESAQETAAAKFDRHPIAGHSSGPIRKPGVRRLCDPVQVMITTAWPAQLSEHYLDRCLAAVRSRSEAEMSTVHRASSTAPARRRQARRSSSRPRSGAAGWRGGPAPLA